MITEKIDTDVLIVGGGIAGLMAAIRASEMGVNVLILEKGNSRFSGAGRAGCDHFWAYIPEYHGSDKKAFLQACMKTNLGKMLSATSPSVIETWTDSSFEIVQLWEKWGIPMKHDGKYHFQGHSFPAEMMTHLKYKGSVQKKVLVKEARKRGVNFLDRIMVFDLLSEGGAVQGAVGVDTRTDRVIAVRAKSVIISTGAFVRMYPNVTPALMANNTKPPTTCGDGRAMAYRAGANLVNIEMIGFKGGVKNYTRGGQGTWMGVVRDPEGKPVGKYLEQPNRQYHDIIMEVDGKLFQRAAESGKGPTYMDCTGISDDDLNYLTNALWHEGNGGLLAHLEEEGCSLQKNPIEFATYEIRCSGRIESNAQAETNVRGLYSAGDESMFSVSGAAVFGWVGGENAAKYAKENRTTPLLHTDISDQLKKTCDFIASFKNRTDGPDWYEANMALNQTMLDYAGATRSEPLLQAGLAHLKRLRKKLHESAIAPDQWQLTRILEVVNLYEIGELMFLGALERKESRGHHKRVDYPYTDPLLNGKRLLIKQVNGTPTLEWADLPD